ncbi:MAG: aspartate aminotransferase family protein, partial [Acidimicrobiales bacterium]
RFDPGTLSASELNDFTLAWARSINDSGAAFVSPSILDGSWMVRVSIGVESTERHHLERLWSLMNEAVHA